MIDIDIVALGTYNAEVSRGIKHTKKYKKKMKKLQKEFDVSNSSPTRLVPNCNTAF